MVPGCSGVVIVSADGDPNAFNHTQRTVQATLQAHAERLDCSGHNMHRRKVSLYILPALDMGFADAERINALC
jgi:hypothetical protein